MRALGARSVRGIVFGGAAIMTVVLGCKGPAGPEGVVSWGACSDAHSGSASYNCTELRGDAAGAAGYRSQCEHDLGVYSDACPPGAVPGCCTLGPDATGFTQVTCSYDCTDAVCSDLPGVCAANGGTWGMR